MIAMLLLYDEWNKYYYYYYYYYYHNQLSVLYTVACTIHTFFMTYNSAVFVGIC